MKWLFNCTVIAVAILATPGLIQAEGVVLVTSNSSLSQPLSREQVRNLYMGASLGYGLKPVALPPKNRLRALFNTQVIGLPESRIQSYWAQMKFTGRMSPPREIDTEKALLEYLKDNPEAVGYCNTETHLPDSLRIIYQGN